MSVRVRPVYRIITGIGIAVEPHARFPWVIGVWREEPSFVGIIISCMQILQPGLGVEALADVAFGLRLADLGQCCAVGRQRQAVSAVIHLGGGPAHAGDHAVGGQMILQQKIRGQAFAFDIRVEIGGEQACGVGAVDQNLSLRAQVEIIAAVKALGGALTIRAIAHFCAVAVLGDGQRPVLAVIGKASGEKRAWAIHVIAGGIAICIVSDRGAADGVWGMRMPRRYTLGGIDHIGVCRTELGIKHHVTRIIISIGSIISRAVLIIGTDQTVEPVIAISPRPFHIGRGGGSIYVNYIEDLDWSPIKWGGTVIPTIDGKSIDLQFKSNLKPWLCRTAAFGPT